ncbi:aquaporin Z [Citricoccus sp. I39-566]|uniref:aquaporin Z n=1 Tax=Citricoccus sp. I39-566 TaxID=3073268 RepID=UPI00286B386A|nr:aquaporin Z [Citricoccus sp. I39-566]WMY78873.1 aquaporin Z [Citricoccus sp. I39-566]
MSSASAHSTAARWSAEFLGTFVLVFGGCGTAVFAAQVLDAEAGVNRGVGFLGVALAFGLTVLVMAYAVGHVSGGHFNPAVTLGTALAGRTKWSDVGPYLVVQILGATVAGAVLLAVASGKEGFSAAESGFATNGYGERSPDGYSLLSVLIIEVVLTAVFLYVILGATDRRAPAGFGPLAIGLSLTLIHLISIPVSNTSVNPARSLGVAWFAGGEALGQVWLFLVAPLVGAAIAGLTYQLLFPDRTTVNADIAGHEAHDATA